MSKALIDRIQQHIRTGPTVDMAVHPPICPNPPVSDESLAAAETRLGFPLPPLIRALYTLVADGGYGPGYGVIQLDGDDYTLVESRLRMNQESTGEWMWPERLVELVNWGCLYFSSGWIAGTQPSCPVFFYNADLAVGDAGLADCLLLEADSFGRSGSPHG